MSESFVNNETVKENIDTSTELKNAFKEIFDEALKRGIEINNEETFERFKNMFKNQGKLDISNINFNDLNNGNKIFIKKDEEGFIVFDLVNTEVYGTNLRQLGIIQSTGYEKNGLFKEIFLFISGQRGTRKKGIDYSLPNDEQITDTVTIPEKEETQIKPKQEPKVEKIQETTDIPYQIKKGDYLWKIISEQYGLDATKDKSTIWQIMEIIRKDPKNKKAIKDIDTIFAGETINLPKKIKTTKQDISIIEKK